MKTLRIRWIDGDFEDGKKPMRIHLIRDSRDGMFRWFDSDGLDLEVSGETIELAMVSAWDSWQFWGFRRHKNGD